MNNPLRWPGGKTRFASALAAHFPSDLQYIVEPFAGSAAVSLHMLRTRQAKSAWISDANQHIMDFWSEMRSWPKSLRERTLALEAQDYYEVRDDFNIQGGAHRFYYLNRNCFNGLYRTNKTGDFNVPKGSNKVTYLSDEEARDLADVLDYATLRTGSYDDVLVPQGAGVGILVDPPYVGTFSNYTQAGFSNEDHARLAAWCIEQHEAGAHVVVTNSDTAETREIYNAFQVVGTLSAHRSIAAKASARKRVAELILVPRGQHNPQETP